MVMYLTIKTRIYPTKPQVETLWTLSEQCLLLYNFALQERIENWKDNQSIPIDNRDYITYYDQSKNLPNLKRTYPEYKWVYSKVLQNVLRNLDHNFRSFFELRKRGDTKARPPRYKGKQYFTTLCYIQSGFKLADKIKLYLSHNHPSGIELVFTLPTWTAQQINRLEKIKQVEAFCQEQRWYLSITYEVTPPPYNDNGLYQAIDLGITNLVSAVNLHGKFIHIKNRRADLYWRPKIAEVKSKRDHCKKYSRRWNRLHKKIRKMEQKCAFQLRDFQHKISKQIVNNTKAHTIIVGELAVKQMAQRKKGTGSGWKTRSNRTLSHSIQNTGSLGRFIEFLTYKATLQGKRIIRIDERYTSKTCARCGKRHSMHLHERVMNCDCGFSLDRDLNSAINLMKRFLTENLSHQPPMNGESFREHIKGFTTIDSPNCAVELADS